MAAAPFLKKVCIRSGLALGALLASLLLVEAGARIVGLAPQPQWHSEGDPLIRPCADPILRFENNPSSRSRQVYGLPGGGLQVAEFSIDQYGLRGGWCGREKPPGIYRIACVGDSQTFGDGVSDDETWPFHLQQQLDPERARIQVLNCGVNAYETEQEVRLLETRVLDFDPDLVLLAYFVNDASIRSRIGQARQLPQVRPSRLSAFLAAEEGWFASLRSVSCFLTWSADSLKLREGLEYFGKARAVYYADDATGWITAREKLRHARDLLDERGIPFVVALYPFMYRSGSDDQLSTHDAYAIVARFLEDEGIRYVDLEPAYAGMDVDGLRVHARNAHTNGAGHRVAAEALAEFLRQAEYVQ